MKQITILFLTSTKATLYYPHAAEVSFPLPKNIVNAGEVVDKEHFENLLSEKITSQEKNQHILVVLDESLTYEKEINPEIENATDFLDIVPFERVVSRVFHIKKTE